MLFAVVKLFEQVAPDSRGSEHHRRSTKAARSTPSSVPWLKAQRGFNVLVEAVPPGRTSRKRAVRPARAEW